jgi:hypothetical protein
MRLHPPRMNTFLIFLHLSSFDTSRFVCCFSEVILAVIGENIVLACLLSYKGINNTL